jgi:hypothetical protein
MRYRTGVTRGTYVSGDERPTIIDTGMFTVTSQRALFVGAKQSREWAWSKLVGFHDDDGEHWTGIAVSNRQKVSGVSYGAAEAYKIRFYLELGAAMASGTVEQLLSGLEEPA